MARNDFDFYPTPPAAVHALGRWLAENVSDHIAGTWLDPCVGAGAIPLWLSPHLEKGAPPSEKGAPPSVSWDALDIQPRMLATSRDHNAPFRFRAGRALDSLATPWRPMEYLEKGAPPSARAGEPYTGIALNPPYGADCERWILKAVQEARAGVAGTHRPRPYVFVLTRVNFWADGQRVRTLAPDRLLWLEKRLSFTGDGRTDSSAHCWAMWNVMPRPRRPPGQTIVETVPLPPVSDEEEAIHREMLGHAKARQVALDLSAPVAQ